MTDAMTDKVVAALGLPDWINKKSQTKQRMDSVSALGLTLGAVMWIGTPPFALGRADAEPSRPNYHWLLNHLPLPVHVPKFEVTTTNSKLQPGLRSLYRLLPFRALEENDLPVAIRQRWEVSVAASMSAEWSLWFQTLNLKQQKAHVQSLFKKTKDDFWAVLFLEYEGWSKPRRTRYIAAAAKVQVILEQERLRRPMKKARRAWKKLASLPGFEPWMLERHELFLQQEDDVEPLSAPVTPQNLISLKLRLAPSYFRLPNHTFRFAEQIFRGKSHDEAVAEQKANFNSWAREKRVLRVEGRPDVFVWGNVAVQNDAMPKFTPKKEKSKKEKSKKEKPKKEEPKKEEHQKKRGKKKKQQQPSSEVRAREGQGKNY